MTAVHERELVMYKVKIVRTRRDGRKDRQPLVVVRNAGEAYCSAVGA